MVLFCSVFCEGCIKESLSLIPKEDQIQLERLFKWIICKDSFGYTLWGKKPISTTYWPLTFSPTHLFKTSPRSADLEESMNTWKRHRKLFPIKNFIFSDHYLQVEEELFHEIYIINTKECQLIYEQYPQIFTEAESAQDILINDNSINHQRLGLLFGFGRHNTELFVKMNDIKNSICQLPSLPKQLPDTIHSIPKSQLLSFKLNKIPTDQPDSFNQKTLLENYLKLKENWIPFATYSQENPLAPVSLPAFMVKKDSQETNQLYKQYSKTRKQINQVIQKPNFLEIVLEKLCEDS